MGQGLKMPTEAELLTKVMLPLVERLGLDRTSKAFAISQPMLEQLKEIAGADDKQAAEDAVYILRHMLDVVCEFHDARALDSQT